MNKEKLKSYFDEITPTNEQKKRMLSEVLKHESKSVKPIPIYKYGVAFAAVLVLGIILSIYPNIEDFNNSEKAELAYICDNNENVMDKTEKKLLTEPKDSNEELIKENVRSRKEKTNLNDSLITENKKDQKKQHGDEKEVLIEENKKEILTSTNNEKDEATNQIDDLKDESTAQDTGENIVMRAMLVGEDEAQDIQAEHNVTYEEIMGDETFGNLFPKKILSGYTLSKAQIVENEYLDAFYENVDGSIYIRIFRLADTQIELTIISPDEILSYENNDYLSFNVLCGDYVVFYEINVKNISNVYDMVISSEYFNN